MLVKKKKSTACGCVGHHIISIWFKYLEIGVLWADWDRAAGANPNDIMLTKIAWQIKYRAI